MKLNMNSGCFGIALLFMILAAIVLTVAGFAITFAPQWDPSASAANSARMNGLSEMSVYGDVPTYIATQPLRYPIVCTIPPLTRFNVGARDQLVPQWREVWSNDLTCIGWAWLP